MGSRRSEERNVHDDISVEAAEDRQQFRGRARSRQQSKGESIGRALLPEDLMDEYLSRVGKLPQPPHVRANAGRRSEVLFGSSRREGV